MMSMMGINVCADVCNGHPAIYTSGRETESDAYMEDVGNDIMNSPHESSESRINIRTCKDAK